MAQRRATLSRFLHRDRGQAQCHTPALTPPATSHPFTRDRTGRVYGTCQEARRPFRICPRLCYSIRAVQLRHANCITTSTSTTATFTTILECVAYHAKHDHSSQPTATCAFRA